MKKEKIELTGFDLAGNASFKDAIYIDSEKWEQMKREEERRKNVLLRKDKILKIRNETNKK
jgi:hypothetical protein